MLTILSLGAGVQSTTLALMAAHGEIGPMPDCAIFADTQAEPSAVYRHLEWLMSPNILPFPVHIVSKGSLRQEIVDACAGKNGAWGRPPFFVKNADDLKTQLLWEALPLAGGDELDRGRRRKRDTGMTRRQCTQDYKLEPIHAQVRRLAGIKPRSPGPRHAVVEQWVGISQDERLRAKPAKQRWIRTRWPLLDLRMTRAHCLDWLRAHDYALPPKSACTFCPFHSDQEWQRLRDDDAASFADAVAIDHALRDDAQHFSLKGTLYLHRSLRPLDQVEFVGAADPAQMGLFASQFGNECQGVCGL